MQKLKWISLLSFCLLGNGETYNYPLETIVNLSWKCLARYILIWDENPFIWTLHQVIRDDGFKEEMAACWNGPQQLLTSCRNSSLLLVKLTIDYLSFIRIEKKSGDYFMEGSLQPCNYNIYWLDYRSSNTPYLCQLNWVTRFCFDFAMLVTFNTTLREFFRCVMNLFHLGDIKF